MSLRTFVTKPLLSRWICTKEHLQVMRMHLAVFLFVFTLCKGMYAGDNISQLKRNSNMFVIVNVKTNAPLTKK